MTYRSSDLDSFRARLVEMRDWLTRQVADIENAIVEDLRPPGDVSNVPTHPAVFDSEGLDRNVALAQNEAQILEEVEDALGRLDAGAFGRCVDCGGEIDRRRLDALPYAARCIGCAAAKEGES